MQRAPPRFDKRQAPSNYVAGAGRGAVGFVTRSDLGPQSQPPPGAVPGGLQRPQHQFGQAPKGYIAGVGRGSGGFGETKPNAESQNVDRGDYSEFDAFQGFKGSLFANASYDDDDRKADAVWSAIDDRLDGRRKRRREEKEKERLAKYRKERPKISDQFADLKQDLKSVSTSEWDAIPEAHSGGVKHRKKETFVPVTDSLIADQLSKTGKGSMLNQIEPSTTTTPSTYSRDLTKLSTARDKILRLKLDKMSDSVSGQTVVDPQNYLTGLNSVKVASDADIGDVKKARLLLKSVTTTNPTHAPGWIAAARMEEVAGKMLQARKIIKEGCSACPGSEDIWLEAARLHNPSNAKVLLASAVKHIPTSVKIWLAAADLEGPATETDPVAIARRKAVLRRALEFIPNSVKLWQAAIELESEEDAKVLLSRAVECVPESVSLWLALARLETYENAKVVLNKARGAIPTEPKIWIAAAQLNEANGEVGSIQAIIELAVREMSAARAVIDRDTWLGYARDAEKTGSVLTCAAIVRTTLGLGIEPSDRKTIWLDDAKLAEKHECFEMIRTIYSELLKVFPSIKTIWLKAVSFERKHGTESNTIELLSRAVEACPQEELLWLVYAKQVWQSGDAKEARTILERAFAAQHNSEAIWLAAVKIVWESSTYDQTEKMLQRARDKCPTARVWMKSALVEIEQNHIQSAEKLLEEGRARFPSFHKLWLMSGQLLSSQNKPSEARKMYLRGLDECPNSVPLWLHAARLEESLSSPVKARSVLELGRIKNPKNPQLWLEAVRLEVRSGDTKMADAVMAKAIQECPSSGILWAEKIRITPRAQQKGVSNEAHKRCDNDPFVVLAFAKLLWQRRKFDKAKKWLHRAVTLDPDLGDAWATYFKLVSTQTGLDSEETRSIVTQCVKADPHHGEVWCKVRKQTENRRKTVEEVLALVAMAIEL